MNVANALPTTAEREMPPPSKVYSAVTSRPDVAPALPPRPAKKPGVVCRQMQEADFESVIDALERGFPERARNYWERGLQRMRDRPAPADYPRYGYVMAVEDRIVGVIVLIFSEAVGGGTKCNVSSWTVDADYRGFSHMLLAIPLRLKGVTFLNISPAPNTLDTIAAQGFRPFSQGAFHAFPALAGPVHGCTVREVGPGDRHSPLLARHASYGCLSFEVSCAGEVFPFVFQKTRWFRGKLPCAQLVHCPSTKDFVRFAGPVGRRLLAHGLPSVVLHATGPVAGLPGRFVAGRRIKYFRGDARPMLNDLGDTELVIFGP